VSVGFVFKKKNGDIVEKGDILGYIHGNDEDKVIKCFYSETGDDIINSCINYINSYDNSKSI